MSFLAPLALLFALTLPVIIAFYLLKLRRTRREVSSTLLWRRAAEDMQANAPFQKLRRNLLLLLQLLVAALLVLGLARPYLNMRAAGARNMVLLIDHSASMSARDGEGGLTRLEQAKARAAELVRGMRPGDQTMVVAFAAKATVLSQFTPDRARLESVIRSIAPTELPNRAADAFALAQSLARPTGAEVVVLSDGAFSTDGISLAQGAKVRFETVGTGSNNAGIVALDLRRSPEKPKEFQIFATVRNYRDQPMEAQLEVQNNDKLVDVRPVSVGARGQAGQVFNSSLLTDGRVELRLVNGPKDDFPADDAAYAVIKPPGQRRILLVSAGNYFLERALRQLPGRNFEVVRVAPSQYTAEMKGDITIFDGAAPPGPLAPGSYFFINALPPVPGFAESGEEENPFIFDWNPQHPVMRYAELGDVQISRAKKYALPQATQTVAESRELPLISVYSADNVEIVLWAFDIFETNFPLRVAFPILVSNTTDWLLRKAPGAESAIATTGQVLQVDAPPETKRVTVFDPSGQGWALSPNAGGRMLFDRTSRAGFYRVELDGKPSEEFGVSLADEYESDIAPRQTLALGGGEIRANTAGTARSNREVWTWFALAALAFICLEWAVYHRRVWV